MVSIKSRIPLLRKNRCSSGINDLDLLLEGGYLRGGLTMIIGPTGMEKNAFALHFTDAGIKSNEIIVYITSDVNYKELIKRAFSLNFDFKKAMNSNNLIFIDCSSSNTSLQNQDSINGVVSISGPSALNDLSLAIKEVIQKNPQKNIRVVFNSLSTLVLYNPKTSITKFIGLVGDRIKKINASALFLVEDGMHEKTLLASLEHLMDEVYYIQGGDSFSISSPKLPMTIPLKLSPVGIEVN